MTRSQGRPHSDGAAKTPVNEATFAALLQRTQEGVIVRDGSGQVVFANPAAQTLLERTEDQLIGNRLTDLGIEWLYEDGAQVLRPTPCLAGNTVELGRENESIVGLRRGGALVRWLRLVVHSFDDDGELKTMMLLSDVTNDRLRHAEALALKRQLEIELDTRTAELQRALGDAKTLAIAIANDLRVPLTQVDGHLNILREFVAETPEAQLSLRRVQEIVRDLRDFSSTTHDLAMMTQRDDQRRSVSLALLCTNASKDFLVGRDVALDLDGLGSSKVMCDPNALRGAITAMLSLAYECRTPNGRITLATSDTGYSATLRVHVESDPAQAARILNSTLESPNHRFQDDVAGVRFLMVKKAASLHDGAFWFVANGNSTEFLLSLPNAEVAIAA